MAPPLTDARPADRNPCLPLATFTQEPDVDGPTIQPMPWYADRYDGELVNEREAIDRGWFYVIEPDEGRWAPEHQRLLADDGAVLTRRLHGHVGRIETVDASGASLLPATLLRASNALGRAMERLGFPDAEALLTLGPSGSPRHASIDPEGRIEVFWDGPSIAQSPSHHPVEAAFQQSLEQLDGAPGAPRPVPAESLPSRPVPRALFFESLMNTDLPHNDKEISQGILHLLAPLRDLETEVVLVNAKMPITGEVRPVHGLERLEAALAEGEVQLVGITLLEGYWEGVVKLIHTLRRLGCRAHIAVGGVMPSLAPEHVAAHLPEVSFVCRGAGEEFIPALARILGPSTIDEPWSDAQRRALLGLRGLIAVERAGGRLRLLSARSDQLAQVENLDRVPLDLSYVQARHIEGGIEINTSRGCIHRCSFCSILGRESYQARSAGSVFDVLAGYEHRFRQLYGDAIPPNAYRVHISDDDFACDRHRAAAFFSRLRDTPFRLSSVQVAVGDLCRREGGRLLNEPDHELLDTITPDCFADHGRPIPRSVYFEDHRSRDWSSFLQIGVETYDDAEIARLGKGYKRSHIRTIVADLARRGLHMDGYFILSNADTSPRDLVAVFEEVSRLKLRFPEHFHLRFPVVQHLVSYFTAASHRRHVRRGRRHLMRVRHEERVSGHPEFDYPFIEHDIPADPWIEETVSHTFVTDDRMYLGNLDWLRNHWLDRWRALPLDHPDRARIAPLLRRLDDADRRLVAEALRHAASGDAPEWPGPAPLSKDVIDAATRALGPVDTWIPVLRAAASDDEPLDIVLLPGASPEAALGWARSTSRPIRWLQLDLAASALATGQARLLGPEGEVSVGSVSAPPPPAPLRVLRVLPEDLPGLDAAIRRLPPGCHLTLRPQGVWSGLDATRLAQVLQRLGSHPVVWSPDAGPHTHALALDAQGAIGPWCQVDPEGRLPAQAQWATVDDLTHLERHVFDRHDPARWPKATPTQHRRETAAARQVWGSWLRHRETRSADATEAATQGAPSASATA